MEHDNFMNKIKCTFGIISHDTDCKFITQEIGIEPTRFFNQGDTKTSKHTSRIISRPYTLWVIESKPVISEDIDLSPQIQYFEELLHDKIDVLQKFRDIYNFEIYFDIDIETEDAGAGIVLRKQELEFINKISSRFSCRFIAKENI